LVIEFVAVVIEIFYLRRPCMVSSGYVASTETTVASADAPCFLMTEAGDWAQRGNTCPGSDSFNRSDAGWELPRCCWRVRGKNGLLGEVCGTEVCGPGNLSTTKLVSTLGISLAKLSRIWISQDELADVTV
jgi:hypothetical protein